jgi:hypothetical protein
VDEKDGSWAFSEDKQIQVKKRISKSMLFVMYTQPFWVFLVAVDLITMATKSNDMSLETLAALGKKMN